MALFRELITLSLLFLSTILFLILLLRTLTNMYARGSRALLLLLMGILLMTVSLAEQEIVTQPNTKIYLYMMGLFYFILVPSSSWLMAIELVRGQRRKYPKIVLPMLVVETGLFILMAARLNSANPPFIVDSCEKVRFFTTCQFSLGTSLYLYVLFILLPTLIAGLYLLRHYFQDPHAKDSSQILAVSLAILSIPVTTGIVVLLFANQLALAMGVAYLVMGLLLFNAVYNHKILAFQTIDEPKMSMVDDIMFIINDEHIIQDFNLSTLNVFRFQVRDLTNVRMEHAFIDFPQIVELFHNETIPEKVELLIDDVVHEFEPSVVTVTDPDTNKPIGRRLQLHDITELEEQADTASISRDRLTDQYTKETFYALASRVFNHAKRARQPIAISVIDIDNFQTVNSRYTWVVGDEALIQLVRLIRSEMRNTDLLSRFDSDNFVLLMPNTDENVAYQICTRIKEAVATNIFSVQEQEFQFTISQGYSVFDGSTESSLEGFYETARTGLMQSRGEGRNRLAFKELRK